MTRDQMTATKDQRRTIKAEAESRGNRYRITGKGEVHFYGRMPNSIETGWWLFAQSPSEAAERIDGIIA